jgi:DNA-binding SARP family transcriptional activator
MHQWWYRMTGPLPFSATGPMFRVVSNPAAPETPPLRLQLLGPLAHQGPATTDAYLARPKQAALLAYLACAGAGRLVRRDHLAALFWPELGALGARAALRKGLHAIRRAFGDALLLTRGDEEVGVDPAHCMTDVAAFHAALAADHLAEALELFRGPLLDGFQADSAGFARWLEEERSALAERAADAAWQLARRYEQGEDLTSASRWARRAARLARGDERRVRRVMELLARAGDRAGALRTYEALARELRDELQLEPAPETTALAMALRAPA